MLPLRKCSFCVLPVLCVCITVVAFAFFHVKDGIIAKQIFKDVVRNQYTAKPEGIFESDSGYIETGSLRFTGPIDLVYTWVNGSDPALIEEMKKFDIPNIYENATPNRFRDWGTLRYSLRSVEKYANWFRYIYIVTNGQVPRWLNTKNYRVFVVKHSEIFQNKSHLPTFNSRAIESNIHRIPGLSKQFVYMNDDFFLARPVEPGDFYTIETGFKIRFASRKVPNCSLKCKLSDVNNGICDTDCNTSRCDWDGDDCLTEYHHKRQLSGLRRYESYHAALMYTVFLYNKAFGYVYRGIPAHVPYLIDKTLVTELQTRFPEEWQRTSASRFRDHYNFQYAFAYYHYLMRPQMWTKQRTRNLATTYQNYTDYIYLAFSNTESLKKSFRNFSLHKNRKFVCINDLMSGWNSTEKAQCQMMIYNFFLQLFPNASSFELDEKR